MEIKDEGICRFCLKTFAGRSMGRHLASCPAKKQKDAQEAAQGKKLTTLYHLKISGHKPYWLHIEMPASAKLADLDSFLRDIWLECCGHLSEFTINGLKYSSPGGMEVWWGPKPKSMNAQLHKVLNVQDKFEYEYDFGSTTHLEGHVMAARQGVLEDKVSILARNAAPTFRCANCDAEATYICTDCWEPYCEDCLTDHQCGDEMALPVVNSPRMGVCGYSGEFDFDDFNPE
jgi:hypothetical protein